MEPTTEQHTPQSYLTLKIEGAGYKTTRAVWDSFSEEEKEEASALLKEYIWQEDHAMESSFVESDSGKYTLEVTRFRTLKGSWNYSRGRVRRTGSDEIIAEVRRNYSAFPYAFVEDHPNGHDYLVCGEDYQGQTVVELDTGERRDYLPQKAKKGFGFCWAAIHPSPDGNMLAVEGCFWACPYEVLVVDFSNPLEGPWSEFHRETRWENFFGWKDNNSCEIGRRYEVRRSDGKPEYQLTEEEWEEVPDDDEGYDAYFEEKEERHLWTRPADIEMARVFIREVAEHIEQIGPEKVREQYLHLLEDYRVGVQGHLRRLSPQDKETLLVELSSELACIGG